MIKMKNLLEIETFKYFKNNTISISAKSHSLVNCAALMRLSERYDGSNPSFAIGALKMIKTKIYRPFSKLNELESRYKVVVWKDGSQMFVKFAATRKQAIEMEKRLKRLKWEK